MSDISDIWKSMQDESYKSFDDYKKRTNQIKKKSDGISIVSLINGKETKSKVIKREKQPDLITTTKKSVEISAKKAEITDISIIPSFINSEDSKIKHERVPITASEILIKINRDVNTITEGSSDNKKKSITRINDALFKEYILENADYAEVFHEICKPIFRLYADPVEKCREIALRVTNSFFDAVSDLVPVLGYFMPALLSRSPATNTYDEEMKIFVSNITEHEEYRRGRAVERQDKLGCAGPVSVSIIESSEEIRYLAVKSIGALVNKLIRDGSQSILHPYFHEVILYLQAQLKDPYPEIKLETCKIIESLGNQEEYVSGMKYYAVALVRALLPVLRHRHAKCRAHAINAVKVCVAVPDRAKRKGSGTEAIADLVGFREENVLPIASFYTSTVQINYLADLVSDPSVSVKENLVSMLTVFLCEIGDRYDHQTKLLPYLLDLLTDQADSVALGALSCLQRCGLEYESEHSDEIIERRQYGVDGDDCVNLNEPFPRPFTERPRIGIRLYVRGNTKRFLTALVNELTNWVSKTRLKSAQLLKMIVILCEESLTVDAHFLLPAFIKALGFAKNDKDKELHEELTEVYKLLGRYIKPDVYLHYILPRLRGDSDVLTFGPDSAFRATALEFLYDLITGTKPSQLPMHFAEMIETLTNSYVIDPASEIVLTAGLEVVHAVLLALHGRGQSSVIGSYFLATGRLTSLDHTLQRCFEFLVLNITSPAVHNRAVESLILLSKLESFSTHLQSSSIDRLFIKRGPKMLSMLLKKVEFYPGWSTSSPEYSAITFLTKYPGGVVSKQLNQATNRYLFIDLFEFYKEAINNSNCSQESRDITLATIASSALHSLEAILDLNISGTNLFKGFNSTGEVYGIFPDNDDNQSSDRHKSLHDYLNVFIGTFIYNSVWESTLQLQAVKILFINFYEDLINEEGMLRLQKLWQADGSIYVGKNRKEIEIKLLIPEKVVDQMKEVIPLFTSMLDDSDDNVRDLVIENLNYAILFIPPDPIIMKADETMNLNNLLKKLIDIYLEKSMQNADLETTSIDNIDLLLKSLGSIRPQDIEQIMRELIEAGYNKSPDLLNLCSEIITHCDLIKQFKNFNIS